MIGTVVVHRRRVVRLPARSVARRAGLRAAWRERALLTARPGAARLDLPPIVLARRRCAEAPPSVPRGVDIAAPRQWPWALASLALILLVVAACGLLAR